MKSLELHYTMIQLFNKVLCCDLYSRYQHSLQSRLSTYRPDHQVGSVQFGDFLLLRHSVLVSRAEGRGRVGTKYS